MKDDRRGFSFGFALAGLLSATLTYFAFTTSVFDGPAWRSVLVTLAIGGGSAALLLGVERLIDAFRRGGPTGRPVTLKGDWACPSCGAAYVPEATECSDCQVPLVRRDEHQKSGV